MNDRQSCPDATRILDSLKDFQNRSVERVFQRLYLDDDYTNRFLIADEVGLGKTLVARGVIAKSVEHLWDKVPRIDIIYICSNREIASQNINRLNITAKKQFSVASRLTLLPLKISDIKKQKLNFISFTPGTSFDLHSRTGIMLERALIYHMLREGWNLHRAGAMNVFQDWASRESWHGLLRRFRKEYKIDQDLSQEFLRALEMRIQEDRAEGNIDIKDRFFDLRDRFKVCKIHKNVKQKDRRDAASLIGEFRKILAQSCLEALEPDLVILDEFQRFKHLLEGQDEMSQLAQHLFNYENKEMPTKIILLSATPYKMYTMAHEEQVDNHYKDFISTVRFLFDSDDKTQRFDEKLKRLRNELLAIRPKTDSALRQIKKEIEHDLRTVMVRTERLAYTPDRDGMVKERAEGFCQLDLQDLEAYSLFDKVSREVGSGDVVEYWKSAPYLLNLMDDYELKRRFERELAKKDLKASLVSLLKKNAKKMLRAQTTSTFGKIDPANPKMRALLASQLDNGSWKLLWVPASLPYYRPTGAYKQKELLGHTKSLIFSSWQVVPKAIAIIGSYEAERRMVTAYREAKLDYREERKARKPLLVFTRKEDRLAGMANLSLLYPCLTLASKIDPLKVALNVMPQNGIPSYGSIRSEIKIQIQNLLQEAVGDFEEKRGKRDEKWYWAALGLLDRHFYKDELESWLRSKARDLSWQNVIKTRGDSESDTHFRLHVDQFRNFFLKPAELGPPPRNLVEILVKLSLASPAIVALRSFLRLRNNDEDESSLPIFQASALVGAGFRTLYNLSENITLIRSLDEREPYWERVLDYGIAGNLQSVMDEYVHVLKESLGLLDHSWGESVTLLANEISNAVSLRTINLDFDDITVKQGSQNVKITRNSIRCRYALRLGEGKGDEGEEVTRSDQVRAAFNSPFRPFFLATTSIGQEGLDFHQYCHSIYHWNLPANPVDLEQREGRIHRFKGHVIRKNVARHFGLGKLKENRNLKDPWDALFQQGVVDRDVDRDDIVPFWIFVTKNGANIDRHIPCLPLSRDVAHLKDLKSTLALYRMVFGQPRQEDLIEFLKRMIDQKDIAEVLSDFRINLAP